MDIESYVENLGSDHGATAGGSSVYQTLADLVTRKHYQIEGIKKLKAAVEDHAETRIFENVVERTQAIAREIESRSSDYLSHHVESGPSWLLVSFNQFYFSHLTLEANGRKVGESTINASEIKVEFYLRINRNSVGIAAPTSTKIFKLSVDEGIEFAWKSGEDFYNNSELAEFIINSLLTALLGDTEGVIKTFL